MKYSSLRDKTSCRVAAKQVKNQLKTISRPRVRKSLTTKKLMTKEFFNDSTKMTINRKTATPSRITLQQEEYGIAEKCGSKEFHKLNRACSRRPDETADGIKYDPLRKEKR